MEVTCIYLVLLEMARLSSNYQRNVEAGLPLYMSLRGEGVVMLCDNMAPLQSGAFIRQDFLWLVPINSNLSFHTEKLKKYQFLKKLSKLLCTYRTAPCAQLLLHTPCSNCSLDINWTPPPHIVLSH